MTLLKISKLKMTPKYPKNKNLKNESHVRRPQIKKVQKTNYSQN